MGFCAGWEDGIIIANQHKALFVACYFKMTPKELISQSRLLEVSEIPKHLVDTFAFKPTEPLEETSIDLNVDFRIEVVEELLHDFSKKDLLLIRQLYKEELACERLIWRHDNIYQLSYYLFELGQLEDCFLIYEAKYQIKHMDIATMMDKEMLTVGHNIDKVISFVSQKFRDPEIAVKFDGLLEELNDLKENPDFNNSEEYKKFLKGYFRGHDTSGSINANMKESDAYLKPVFPTMNSRKPWWKFWS